MPADDAGVTAVMGDTDLSGVASHGTGMLPHCYTLFTDGRFDRRAVSAMIHDAGPVVLIDSKHGIGVAGVTGSNYYGAVGRRRG